MISTVVAADPERAAAEGHVVARVLDVDEQPQQRVAVDGLADRSFTERSR
jgi:hypothetical protein